MSDSLRKECEELLKRLVEISPLRHDASVDEIEAFALRMKQEGDKRLIEAVAMIVKGFDEGVFVRSTDDDIRPDWAIKAFPYLQALGVAVEAVRARAEKVSR